ncbi:MAG: protein translocase subunit SecD [Rhodospirillales bacterium]|nr:protein translocase subunit SecD [Rhodospirillales bacterium]MCW8861528.1 protein translocase subunit SecD [Rhodospirillales bacterium]MCW8952899.1 protein translocase subunit SecD [Rhodospirillales bacterium]MCW8971374.1 protein translocase subunit SecD [Rhodospirillales bacterium]MCW9001663.1 protein translocase subunit SecD [Rhodospirillales bacterium]
MLYFAKWKIILVSAVCLLGMAFAAPNLFPAKDLESAPDWLPKKQISLGLDLQGGSHLLLEVEIGAVIRERFAAIVDSMRIELRKADIGYRGLAVNEKSAEVSIRDAGRIEDAAKLIRDMDDDIVVDVGEEGLITVHFTEQALKARITSAVDQSIEIVRRRIDETGVREPTIVRQGEDRILVQLPGIDDPERIKRLLGKTAKMSFHLVDHKADLAEVKSGRAPPGSVLMPSANEMEADGTPRMYVVRKRVMVSGESLVDSQPSFQDSGPVVTFRFDSVGGKRFGNVTRDNVNRLLAIVLDGKVISAPVIREAILGGSGVISGRYTVQETQDLALLLRAGALPAPLTILEERTVGPGLGADSIEAGKIASTIGLVLVIVFMAVVYRFFGALADIALLVNITLIIGSLSLLQATLTLPGIAGIVLTIGMAVDANVLIFERIREELRAGRTPISAIDSGYSRAITTIIDANLTTLIAAVLLFEFGSGPVRGFAVTLAIGIATSMFTATLFTRMLVSFWVRRKRPQSLSI